MKKIAFAGLANTGKSSWINRLSRSHMITGNWSGATVEKNEAFLKWKGIELNLIDLPGIAGFYHQSDEERITEFVLTHEKIDCIVCVLDSCHMASSLRLLIELRNFQIPIIALINFKDEADYHQIHIDVKQLAQIIDLPVVYGSAFEKHARDEILSKICSAVNEKVNYRPILRQDADQVFTQYLRFHDLKTAIQLFKAHDEQLYELEKEHAVKRCMMHITGSIEDSVIRTCRLDCLMMCSLSGRILFFTGILSCFLIFVAAGIKFSELLTVLFSDFEKWFLTPIHLSYVLSSFLNNVVFSSIETAVSFVPVLFMLTTFHKLIEESGLMARICLISDTLMRTVGLTGKSFLCFLLAHGCNVPAVIASTSLEDAPIRRKTALLIPFCCCSARFAVLVSFVNTMFTKSSLFIILICYGTGIFLAVFLSVLLQKFKAFKISDPQLIELPCYRKISFKIVMSNAFHACSEYAVKVFLTLFVTLSVVWFLSNMPWGQMTVYEVISSRISTLFLPLQFGKYWGYTAAMLPGLIAKEASYGILMMLMETNPDVLSNDAAVNLIFIIFHITTIPCIMTLVSQKQKYGLKTALLSALFSFVFSYLLCFVLNQFIMFF